MSPKCRGGGGGSWVISSNEYRCTQEYKEPGLYVAKKYKKFLKNNAICFSWASMEDFQGSEELLDIKRKQRALQYMQFLH
jgi:hypothetical protein